MCEVTACRTVTRVPLWVTLLPLYPYPWSLPLSSKAHRLLEIRVDVGRRPCCSKMVVSPSAGHLSTESPLPPVGRDGRGPRPEGLRSGTGCSVEVRDASPTSEAGGRSPVKNPGERSGRVCGARVQATGSEWVMPSFRPIQPSSAMCRRTSYKAPPSLCHHGDGVELPTRAPWGPWEERLW